jgi:hypothetical protein
MKKFVDAITRRPWRSMVYGLFGILGLLLILLIINEKNWRPLQGKSTWTVTSNYSPGAAYRAIDQNLETSWSSYFPMTFGMFFQVHLPKPSRINGLILNVVEEQAGQPAEWIVKVSLDGHTWQMPVIQKHITYLSMLVIAFAPVKAQDVQIIQTSVASSSSPWMIYELDLLQSVVPWQFERSTLIHCILGVLFVIVSVLLSVQRHIKICTPFIVMTGIILLGWFLRIYDLSAYELSDREIRYFPMLAFGHYTDGEWIKAYFQYTHTGTGWLSLLLIRWAYSIWDDYLVALRITPAIVSICTVFLIFVIWRNISQREKNDWGAILASALVSVSGFHIFLSRRGEFSVSLLFFMLLYLLISYRFLYQQGTSGWAPVLTVLLCIGFFVDPAMRYVPVGILLFGALHLLVQWFRDDRSCLKNQVIRYGIYVVSALPFYLFWMFFVEKDFFSKIRSGIVHNPLVFGELSWALQFCGFTGMVSWILWGVVLVGFGQAVFQRNHREWFWYSQGIGLFMLASAETSALVLITVLVLVLLVRGIHGLLTLLCSRLSLRQTRITRVAVFTLVLLYFGGFAVNSIFFGYALFPYASECYQESSQARAIKGLIQQIKDDPDECKTIAILEPNLTAFYSIIYGIRAYFLKFSELQRLSEQGIFSTYLLAPNSAETLDQNTLTPFLNHYYSNTGQSSKIALYKLRDEFSGQPTRYYWRDLLIGTGHHIEDKQASSGIARIATKADPPGLLAFGPFCRVCTSGRYIARFILRSEGKTEDIVAILEVVAIPHDSLARLELKGTDFVDPNAYQTFDLPFDLDLTDNPAFQIKRLQFVVHVTGKSDVRLDYIELLNTFLKK